MEKIHKRIKRIIESQRQDFVPGKTLITTGLAVYDDREINAIIDSLIKGHFGLAEKGKEFEKGFAESISSRHCVFVNSGSSANLIATDGIKHKLGLKGGEVITPACCFPTTVNPILQLGFTPVFVDIDKTLNITPEAIKDALNNNTKGLVFSHTLGNPCKIDEIMDIAEENSLFVIEDCCDAHGSRYNGKVCGSFGTAATFSFYPAHNMTMGEGGAITTDDSELNSIMRSLRDWGRDCYCETGKDNSCGKRFEHSLGEIPYDHKYIFSRVGYNLRPLELQAAMGLEQLKKLEGFNEIRKRNFKIYQEDFIQFEDYFELPEINEKADPVFFGLPIIIKNKSIKRKELIQFLNKNKIATRLLFSGNITMQPAYKGKDFIAKELKYTEKVARDLFWIGIHPGVTEEMIKYIVSKFREYLK